MQELEYLRNELNQRINFNYNYSDKVMGNMLVIWGAIGSLFLYGMTKIIENKNFVITPDYIVIATFVFAVILFISNLYIRFTSIRYHENLRQIMELASYIAIFYEKEIGKDRTDNDNSWEIANLEAGIIRNKIDEKKNAKKNSNSFKSWHVMDGEFILMSTISTVVIFVILLSSIYFRQNINDFTKIIILLNLVFFIFSIVLVSSIYKHSIRALKNMIIEKTNRMSIFLDYAISNGYYSEDDVKKRFGHFLDTICYKLPSEKNNS